MLEELGGVPISIVGVGPAREQSLVVRVVKVLVVGGGAASTRSPGAWRRTPR